MSEVKNGEQPDTEDETKDNTLFNQLIVGLITLSINLTSNIINVNTTHLSTMFNIPIQNVNVYTNKLITLRTILILIGTIIYGVVSIYNHERDKLLCTISLGLITIVRIILVILLYVSNKLALTMYILLNVEGFIFGMAQLSIVVLFPEYASTIILATHMSGLLVVIIQIMLSICIKNKLLLFKRQCLFCLLFTIVSVGWFVYRFYIKIYYSNGFYLSYLLTNEKVKLQLNNISHKILKNIDEELNELDKIETIINKLMKCENNISNIKENFKEINIHVEFVNSVPSVKERVDSQINSIKSSRMALEDLVKNQFDQNPVSFKEGLKNINKLISELNPKSNNIIQKMQTIECEFDDEEINQLKLKVKNTYDELYSLISLTEFAAKIDTNKKEDDYFKEYYKHTENEKLKIDEIVSKLVERIKESSDDKRNVEQNKKGLIQLKESISTFQNKIGETYLKVINKINENPIKSFFSFPKVYEMLKKQIDNTVLELTDEAKIIADNNKMESILNVINDSKINTYNMRTSVSHAYGLVVPLSINFSRTNQQDIKLKMGEIQTNIKNLDSIHNNSRNYKIDINVFESEIERIYQLINDLKEIGNKFIRVAEYISREEAVKIKESIKEVEKIIIKSEFNKLKENLINAIDYICSLYKLLNKYVSIIDPDGRDRLYFSFKKDLIENLKKQILDKVTNDSPIKNIGSSSSSEIKTLKQTIENLNKTTKDLQNRIQKSDSEIQRNINQRITFSFTTFPITYKFFEYEFNDRISELNNNVKTTTQLGFEKIQTIVTEISGLETSIRSIRAKVNSSSSLIERLSQRSSFNNGVVKKNLEDIQTKLPKLQNFYKKHLSYKIDINVFESEIERIYQLINDLKEIGNKFIRVAEYISREEAVKIKESIKEVEKIIIKSEFNKLKENLINAIDYICSLYKLLNKYVSIIDPDETNKDYYNGIKGDVENLKNEIEGKISLYKTISYIKTSNNLEIKILNSKLQSINQPLTQLQSEIDRAFKQLTKLSNHWYSSSFFYLTMVFVSSLFYCFLYPNILPYALLELEKSYKIVIVTLVVSVIGSGLICFVDNYFEYKEWESYIMFGWVLLVPQLVVFVMSLVTIHSQSWLKCIINSTSVVLILTFVLIVSYSIFESISYVSISNYVCFRLKYDGTVCNIVTYYFTCLLICKFLFSKLSVGYNTTRVSLGYVLPELKPTSSITNKLGMCYWFRKILLHTVTETYQDLRPNIKNYI